MTEVGEYLHLVAKAFANCIAAETGLDQFDRNLLVIVLVVALGQIDGAHAAATELAQDPVRTDASAFFSCDLVKSQSCCGIRRALLDYICARVDVMVQQQLDLRAQLNIIDGIEKQSTRTGLEFQRLREHDLYLLPAFRCDVRYLLVPSRRRSQSFAESHSRFVVDGEISSTSETSSIVSPPKKRSS